MSKTYSQYHAEIRDAHNKLYKLRKDIINKVLRYSKVYPQVRIPYYGLYIVTPTIEKLESLNNKELLSVYKVYEDHEVSLSTQAKLEFPVE